MGVILVGAGPGDPDLMTIKGVKAIKNADDILYDRLVNKDLLQYAKPDTRFIFCGKKPNHHTMTQGEINDVMVDFARKGHQVVRLKGGDPFIFGRGGEEAEFLARHGIPFSIVPGITSGVAAPAYAGIPLTHREYSGSVAFVSGVQKEESAHYWSYLAKGVGTVCFYMGVRSLPHICGKLIEHGRDLHTPVAFIYRGTTYKQETVTGTLMTIISKAKHLENPAMIVVGDVVKLHDKLNWFEEESLAVRDVL